MTMFYVILCDQREFLYQPPKMHSTWRTPAALSLCTQEWHHKSILLQLRHYDIRHQSIYFPLQKTKRAFVHLPLYQCFHLFPLFPALAKSLTLTSEEHSEQNQESPSSPKPAPALSNYPVWTFTTVSFKTIPCEMIWLFHDWTKSYV